MRTSHESLGHVLSGKSEGSPYRTRDPQTTAWIVLWVAFVTFWVLVVGAGVSAKRYYDTAFVPRTATLSLEQGIVLFRDAVTSTLINAQDKLDMREGDALLVGQGARASLSLFEGSRVFLYSGSELELNELRRSRFHDEFTRIDIGVTKGMARFDMGTPSTNLHEFLVRTPHGSAVLSSGNFGVDVSESQTRLSSRRGWASVLARDRVVPVGIGEKILMYQGTVSGPMAEGDQLIRNGIFSQGFAGWDLLDVDEPGRPVERGQRMLLTEKIWGRDAIALRVLRISPSGTHNETGLVQVLNKDVSDYESLLLHTDIRVDEQSLSGGGYMGYEYPVMIRVRYRDATGAQIDWSHGFFHKNQEERPTPNGEQVPQGQWVSYTGELMEVKPRPVHLLSLEVLGAGHSFDGMVANFGLVGK